MALKSPLQSGGSVDFMFCVFSHNIKKILQQNKIRAREDCKWNGEAQRSALCHKAVPEEGTERGLPLALPSATKAQRKRTQIIRKTEGEPLCCPACMGDTRPIMTGPKYSSPGGPTAVGGPLESCPSSWGWPCELHGRGVLWTLPESWPSLPWGNRELSDHLRPTRTRHHEEDKERDAENLGMKQETQVEGMLDS